MQGNLDPNEKAKLDAEWQKMQGLGRRLARQKAIATIVSCLICGVIALPLTLFGGIRGMVLGFPLGILAAWPVRQKLWPKGQFS